MKKYVIALVFAGAATTVGAQMRPAADPSASGTTGLYVVPRADTMHQGKMSFGILFETLAREEGSSNVERGTLVGAFALTDRWELFGSWEPRIGVRRDYLVEKASGVPPVLGPRLNEHPLAVAGWDKGMGDVRLGMKYKFFGVPGEYNGLALDGVIKLPTANDDRGIGTGKVELGSDLIASYEVVRNLGLNGYFGYNWRSNTDGFDLANDLRWGAGLQIGTRSRLQGLVEVYGVSYVGEMDELPPISPGFMDYGIVQAALRLSLHSGLAITGGVNHTYSIDDHDELGDLDIEKIGSFVMVSFSFDRPSAPPPPPPPANRPPTLTCSAERTTLRVGESVRLVAYASDPDGDRLTVRWTASAGSLTSSDGLETTWDSSGLRPGERATIRATATDAAGRTATCEVVLALAEPPPQPKPIVRTLTCAPFGANSSRVDNRCKAVLDDVALMLRSDPAATARIIGHSDASGDAGREGAAARARAENVAEYLVSVHQVARQRLDIRSAGAREPMGDNLSESGRASNRRVVIEVVQQPR